jgi:hypothetical protein
LNSPIALFLYNRIKQTKYTVEALLSCPEAKDSDLFVFCDGPKKEASLIELNAIKEVVAFAKKIKGFKSIRIFEHQSNLGLSNSIVFGINKVFELYDTIIVVEDDIMVSNEFLYFINTAINKYTNNNLVAGISGYSFPIKKSEPYFVRTGSCWGWATFKNVWIEFMNQRNELHVNSIKTEEKKMFNVYNSFYENMFIQNKNAQIQSWAIDFYLYYFLNHKYFLMSGKNLVANIGFDGTGVHKKNGNFLTDNNPILKLKSIHFPNQILETPQVRNKIIKLYKNGLGKPTLLTRFTLKLKTLLKII